MRKALCIGIDYYEGANSLNQCVSDALSMAEVLARNEDGSKNFDVRTLTTSYEKRRRIVGVDHETGKPILEEVMVGDPVTGKDLKTALQMTFAPDKDLDMVLLYFAGHGYADDFGGYILPSDVEDPSEGISLDYVMNLASKCKSRSTIIILDSCHSGAVAASHENKNYCVLPPNTIIMSACTKEGVARDGCFTPLMVEAMKGGAMNVLGEVYPTSVHACIDRALDSWDQRPVFRANMENSVCLRKNKPLISIDKLSKIVEVFPYIDMDKKLDPGYEEDKRTPVKGYEEHDLEKEATMKLLRAYVALNLVVPVGTEFMYQAAMESKYCRLTVLGKYYWKLVKEGKI